MKVRITIEIEVQEEPELVDLAELEDELLDTVLQDQTIGDIVCYDLEVPEDEREDDDAKVEIKTEVIQ